jgi:hypothetical protein
MASIGVVSRANDEQERRDDEHPIPQGTLDQPVDHTRLRGPHARPGVALARASGDAERADPFAPQLDAGERLPGARRLRRRLWEVAEER